MNGKNLRLVVVKNGFEQWDWKILGLSLIDRMRKIAELKSIEFEVVERIEDIHDGGKMVILTKPIVFDYKDFAMLQAFVPKSGCAELQTSKGESTGICLCNSPKVDCRQRTVADFEFVDVADSGQAAAEKFLLKRLIKPSDGLISRFLNRKISTKLSKFLVNTSLTPNMLSVLSFAIGVASAVFIALSIKSGLLIGGILAQIASILDGCDGEVARLKLQFSEFGAWFDRVLDRYADILILAALSVAAVRLHPNSVWLWGVAAITGSLMMSYTSNICDIMHFGHLPVRLGRDLRLFIVFIGAIFAKPFVTLIVLSLLSHAEVLRRIAAFSRDKSCLSR